MTYAERPFRGGTWGWPKPDRFPLRVKTNILTSGRRQFLRHICYYNQNRVNRRHHEFYPGQSIPDERAYRTGEFGLVVLRLNRQIAFLLCQFLAAITIWVIPAPREKWRLETGKSRSSLVKLSHRHAFKQCYRYTLGMWSPARNLRSYVMPATNNSVFFCSLETYSWQKSRRLSAKPMNPQTGDSTT